MQTGQEGQEPRPGEKDDDGPGEEDTTQPHGTGGTGHKPEVKFTPHAQGVQDGGGDGNGKGDSSGGRIGPS
ncbi:hypothetical protein [Actinophytocola sp.]|uniref:hypothetical protein n=1 Tax=Actinophytocola sp. TaxID=1872138 RepID=UPI00389AED5C